MLDGLEQDQSDEAMVKPSATRELSEEEMKDELAASLMEAGASSEDIGNMVDGFFQTMEEQKEQAQTPMTPPHPSSADRDVKR